MKYETLINIYGSIKSKWMNLINIAMIIL